MGGCGHVLNKGCYHISQKVRLDETNWRTNVRTTNISGFKKQCPSRLKSSIHVTTIFLKMAFFVAQLLNNTLITDTFECLCRVNVDLDVLVRPMPGTVRLVQGLDEVNNSRFLHPSRRRIGMVTNAILFTYYFRPLSKDFAATSKTEFPKP